MRRNKSHKAEPIYVYFFKISQVHRFPLSFFFLYNLSMGITFASPPKLFGFVHITALLLIVLFNVFFFFWARKKGEEKLLQTLHFLGLLMLIAEVFKQWFCYIYVFDAKLNLWFFPWQLCSMAMYCSFFVTYIKNLKWQNALLVFLATYSLFSDLVALILPYDMLRDQIILTVHSFAYHGLILSEVILALLVLKKRKKAAFLPALQLFLIMALIAEIINVVSHLIFNDIYVEPNMFYISFSYPTTQPVFHEIAVHFGIFTEIIVYLSVISLFSYLFYRLEYRFLLSGDPDHAKADQ